MLSLSSLIKTEPYPGLRAFQPNEAHLFFGREEQVDKLLERLQNSHFVAVIGPSGCGKSSLVKAGLIPALKTGFLAESGAKWRIAEMRPGEKPFYNLARVLLKTFSNDDTPLELIKAQLKRSPGGLVEVLKSETFNRKENFLLVVDQFEELFRYKQNNNIDEVTAFISLLIASTMQRDVSLHIVITMRSDFLGDCSLFNGLPEILNDNQFLTPRLTRDQNREAIEGPALVCDGYLQPQLVTMLLNDIGVDHDQLPLMQHALMRMWTDAKESMEKSGIKRSDPAIVLDVESYTAIGKLSSALSNHANEVFNKLNTRQQRIAEIMFRRLSERSAEQKDIRIAATVKDIAGVANVSVNDVIQVADFFRSADYNFLMPSFDIVLSADSLLDISHESIMRQWDKMKEWIPKEYDAANKYKRIAADAIDHKMGKGELLTGNDLLTALEWLDTNQPNQAWASRYGGDFETMKDYIERSRIKEKGSKRRKKIYAGLFVLLLSSSAFLSFKYTVDKKESKNKELLLSLDQQRKEAENETKTRIQAELLKAETENKNKIQQQLDTITLINKELDKKTKEIELQKKQLAESNKKLSHSNAMLLDEKYTRELTEKFALYSELDSQTKAIAISYLLKFYSDSNNRKPFYQQLSLIDSALAIREPISVDPAYGLRMIKKMLASNKNPVVESVLLSIINSNIFYKQQVNVSRDRAYQPYFILSANKDRFVSIGDHDKIIKGTFDGKILNVDTSGKYQFPTAAVDKDSTSVDGYYDYNGTSLVGIAYAGDNIIALNKDGKIFEWDRDSFKQVAEIPLENAEPCWFSADGQFVLRGPAVRYSRMPRKDNEPANISIWKISDLKKDSSLKPSIVQNNSGIRGLVFSPKANQFIIVRNDGKLRLCRFDQKDSVILREDQKMMAAGFSPSGNFIFGISNTGKTRVWDTLGNPTDYVSVDLNRTEVVSHGHYTSDIHELNNVNNFDMSSDWKKLIVRQDGQLVLYERPDGGPIFYKSRITTPQKLISKGLGGSSFLKAQFLDNHSIISGNNYGFIQLWNTQPLFTDIEKALATIELPEPAFFEKFFEDPSFYKAALISTDADRLSKIAASIEERRLMNDEYATSISNINKTRQLYKRLIEISPSQKKMEYFLRLADGNDEIYEIETLKDNPDYAFVVAINQETVAIGEGILSNWKVNEEFKDRLSKIYWNLSWCQLFIKDFKKTIISARRGLDLNMANDEINTNLALGYLLDNQPAEAEKIYRKKKSTLKDAFLSDFFQLEEAKIISPNDERVKKIKAILLEKN